MMMMEWRAARQAILKAGYYSCRGRSSTTLVVVAGVQIRGKGKPTAARTDRRRKADGDGDEATMEFHDGRIRYYLHTKQQKAITRYGGGGGGK